MKRTNSVEALLRECIQVIVEKYTKDELDTLIFKIHDGVLFEKEEIEIFLEAAIDYYASEHAFRDAEDVIHGGWVFLQRILKTSASDKLKRIIGSAKNLGRQLRSINDSPLSSDEEEISDKIFTFVQNATSWIVNHLDQDELEKFGKKQVRSRQVNKPLYMSKDTSREDREKATNPGYRVNQVHNQL